MYCFDYRPTDMSDQATSPTIVPADAALLRDIANTCFDDAASEPGEIIRVVAMSESAATCLHAVADVLEKITPHVVRAVERREESLLDAADSMDAAPISSIEWVELRSARRALELLLTPEQRVALDAIAEAEP